MERDAESKPRRAKASSPAGKAAAKGGPKSGSKSGSRSGPKLERRTFERERGGAAKAIADLMPEIVGERHARHCAPEAIRFPPGEKSEGILQLVVTPAHATIVQHVIPEIIERVNRFFGYNAVARVKLRQGEVKAPQAEKRTAPPSLRPIPMELGESLRDIGDPELRSVLESLARNLDAPTKDTK